MHFPLELSSSGLYNWNWTSLSIPLTATKSFVILLFFPFYSLKAQRVPPNWNKFIYNFLIFVQLHFYWIWWSRICLIRLLSLYCLTWCSPTRGFSLHLGPLMFTRNRGVWCLVPSMQIWWHDLPWIILIIIEETDCFLVNKNNNTYHRRQAYGGSLVCFVPMHDDDVACTSLAGFAWIPYRGAVLNCSFVYWKINK